MLASTAWITAAVTAVLIPVIITLLAKMGQRSGFFPPLPELDPAEQPKANDKFGYYAAHVLALLIGVACALQLVSQSTPEPNPLRFSPFDGAGKWIGPFFVMLGVGAAVSTVLTGLLVSEKPLMHLLYRSGLALKATTGLDPRPGTRALGLVVVVVALLLHFGLRTMHATFEESRITWCDWPWESEQERSYEQLREVRIIRTLNALTGRVVTRPHLGLRFADGTDFTIGKMSDHPPGFWEKPAAFVAARAGIEVTYVESD